MNRALKGFDAVESVASALRFKIVALIIWLAGVYTTMLFLAGLLPELDAMRHWMIAVVIQLVLTIAQSEFWSGRRGLVATIAVVVDMAVNAGGLWPLLRNIDMTPTWRLLESAMLVPSDASGAVVLAVTIGVSLFIAAAPERIWR